MNSSIRLLSLALFLFSFQATRGQLPLSAEKKQSQSEADKNSHLIVWTKPEPFGPSLNRSVIHPTLTRDGTRLIFSGKGKHESIRDPNSGKWHTPKLLSAGNNYPTELSADGLTLIFPRNPSGRTGDLYQLKRATLNDKWLNETKLNFPLNSRQDEWHPHLSEDELTMIFASDRKEGFGNKDLWISHRKSGKHAWETPSNLGEYINTGNHEISPTLSPDGLVLCFSRRTLATEKALSLAECWIATRKTNTSSWLQAYKLDIKSTFVDIGGYEFTENGNAIVFHMKESPKSDYKLQIIRRKSLPETRIVTELDSTDSENYCPSLTSNGLTIYWTRARGTMATPEIWTATRESVSGTFNTPQRIATGVSQGAFTPDGLEMIAIETLVDGTKRIVSASRDDSSLAFDKFSPLDEFTKIINPQSPLITSTGNTIIFQRTVSRVVLSSSFVFSTRIKFSDQWKKPQQILMVDSPVLQEFVHWPCVADQGLTLWFSLGEGFDSQLMKSTRTNLSEPFGNYEYLTSHGQKVRGISPRYIAATGELFYSKPFKSEEKVGWQIAVISLAENALKQLTNQKEQPVPVKVDLRKRWINKTYNTIIYEDGKKGWAEQIPSSKKIKWHYRELSRTEKYIELYNPVQKITIRLEAKQMKLSKKGKWGFLSSGYWE
ncbi:MAG: hypothetical protein COA78_12950 [Blastopirellula sp.]|nr:MAG: hypothetical protein COA78_12950 [Blastopirellula sp.]